ncbi:MAG TPA: ATP-dependent helicase C-terminal domain-containing protein, partial [Fibrobacteraceae bacterium]|nr:ATP-dependent helicase C-terminal domain-containing protein [Fibrobacteraceae bacterium]
SALATRAESGKAYRTAADLTILLDPARTGDSAAILVFHLMRSGNQRIQQISRCLFIPIPPEVLQQGQENEERWELLWRNGQERFTGLCIQSVGGQEISRRDCAPQDAPADVRHQLENLTAAAWSERLSREDLSHQWMTDDVQTLLAKMRLASRYFPEYQRPTWDADDWALVMDEFTSGVFLQRDLNDIRFRKGVEEYFGRTMLPWLHQTFPDSVRLVSGRIAHYHYPSNQEEPVEISARVSDFLGMRGEHHIAEGRVPVRYDLLAPNYRTAQKTWDLTGFWRNTYPQIRKELRGRYPRHPWPEDPLSFSPAT